MTNARKVIDEVITPRLKDHHDYLACVTNDLAVERAETLYLYSPYGDQILDWSSVLNPVGHLNPAVVGRVAEQMRQYGQVGNPTEFVTYWPVTYARKLSESLPRTDVVQQVMYFDSPEEARDTAGAMTPKYTIIDFFDREDRPLNPLDVQNTASRVMEAGALLIVDESKAGFGRLGTFWGQERYQVDADITVVGGPAGGGFPFGAVIARPELFDALPSGTGSPTAGNPVICAAGSAVMDEINVGVVEHVNEAATVLNFSLTELRAQFADLISNVWGAGLYQTIEFRTEDIADLVQSTAVRYGLLLGTPKGKLVAVIPPLITSAEEIRRGVDVLAGVLLDTPGLSTGS